MTTKTCKKCGWVLDIRDPSTKCPICKTWFTEGLCRKCGMPVVYYRHGRPVCKQCYDKYERDPDAMRRIRQRRRDLYQEWLQRIKKIPKTYPTLTEAQWLKAVRHFNGCALCEHEIVDTRQYFIPFKDGGRYCDWNIIPVCESCALKIKLNPNYFAIETNKPTGLLNIVDYLEEKIDGALNASTEKNE